MNRENISLMAVKLVTTGQIGQELGLSRQWVDKIIREAVDFPEPELVLPNGTRLWSRAKVFRWFERNPRRRYRRRKTKAAD
jgi:predicted DNA-binding transcriptional regulator AlpA